MPRDANVILLYGNDEFAMRRRAGEFESAFSDATSASMNTARLEARTMIDDDLNNAVNAMPFLAERRLVLLSGPSVRYSNPQSRKKFCEFLEKVPPTARLVIIENVDLKNYKDKARQEKEDEKHWLVKWIKKAGLGLERFSLPAQWEMTGWIIRQTKEQGGQMDQAAAARLAEMVGPDTRQAAQEISKLLAYVNWARPIGLEDVQAASIVTAESDIFAMVDALAQGNARVAQHSMHDLLENHDAFGLWPMVIRQFRLLLLARETMDGGGGVREVQQSLGVPEFVARKVFEQARRFNLSTLEKIYHRLLEIDEAAKTGRMPLDISMEMLVMELS
ncbi:MAG TPA: DNA polymerase III subunit delta [Anaerolineales bacterium]